MKIVKSDLAAIAVNKDQYPQDDMVEIAFAGRSNVGKSSLINSLINRKSLARTSSKPGKTRTINFYIINDQFRLVDLPGYGYAQVSKDEKKKWGVIIEEYLTSRPNLKQIVLVVDIRHSPSKDDKIMYDWIKSFGYKAVIIGTKADKIGKTKIPTHIKMIKNELGVDKEDVVLPYSSDTKYNKESVWELFEKVII